MSTEDPKPEDRIEDLEDDSQDEGTDPEPDDDSGNDDADAGSDPEPDQNHSYRDDIKKAVKRRQAALKRARELEEENKKLKAQNETEVEKARREATEEAAKAAADKYKPVIVRKEAEAGLLEAGVKPEKIKRLIKLMDLDDIDIDEDGDVEGVEEQVESLREEYPELFKSEASKAPESEEPAPRRKRAPRDPDGGPKSAPKKKKTSAEIHFERLTGRS